MNTTATIKSLQANIEKANAKYTSNRRRQQAIIGNLGRSVFENGEAEYDSLMKENIALQNYISTAESTVRSLEQLSKIGINF